MTTVAKSLAAGMPLSAVVGRSEIMDSVHAGGLGGTYGANPVACAAGLAVMEIMEEENLVEKAEVLGQTLMTRFNKWQSEFNHVGEVRGLGAMAGITLVDEQGNPSAEIAKKLVGYCFENGLSILACGIHGNVIRVLMPIVITDAQLEKGLSIMEAGLAAMV